MFPLKLSMLSGCVCVCGEDKMIDKGKLILIFNEQKKRERFQR